MCSSQPLQHHHQLQKCKWHAPPDVTCSFSISFVFCSLSLSRSHALRVPATICVVLNVECSCSVPVLLLLVLCLSGIGISTYILWCVTIETLNMLVCKYAKKSSADDIPSPRQHSSMSNQKKRKRERGKWNYKFVNESTSVKVEKNNRKRSCQSTRLESTKFKKDQPINHYSRYSNILLLLHMH